MSMDYKGFICDCCKQPKETKGRIKDGKVCCPDCYKKTMNTDFEKLVFQFMEDVKAILTQKQTPKERKFKTFSALWVYIIGHCDDHYVFTTSAQKSVYIFLDHEDGALTSLLKNHQRLFDGFFPIGENLTVIIPRSE